MPKGKRGPIPQELDPPAEKIVGPENLVQVEDPVENPPVVAAMVCADCPFSTDHFTEMEEHVQGTGHGGYKAQEERKEIQTELFRPPGVIAKQLKIPLDESFLHDKRKTLADLFQKALDIREEKKDVDADYNDRLKRIDEQMKEIARVLGCAYTYETVNCEWRILDNENARGLFRLDTGVCVEKQPLTAEDRAQELAEAQANNSPDPTDEDAPETNLEGHEPNVAETQEV